MIEVIVLDAGPLGMLTHPAENTEIQFWLRRMAHRGVRIVVPEIADFEVRRELIRAGKINSLKRLEVLKARFNYMPLTTEIMLRAARYWAYTRNMGRPLASSKSLDCDVILAAQASVLGGDDPRCVIVTDNVDHLSLIASAMRWTEVE
jgi:predicted nucleic acid-binding protein